MYNLAHCEGADAARLHSYMMFYYLVKNVKCSSCITTKHWECNHQMKVIANIDGGQRGYLDSKTSCSYVVWRRPPLHNVPSCTGLPKTGATNQNAPRLISEYLCLLRQRNGSNSITKVKETRELREKKTCVVLGRAFRLGRYVRNSNYSLIF